MQYVRSLSGSVSKTWNSINPATLSGAIDVIVVEQENGDLACSPFHVRFGKFSLLRPYEKKVEFRVNGEKTDYSMKLGEGGEAFFVFQTSGEVPADMQTSPLVSPAASPRADPAVPDPSSLQEPDFLNIDDAGGKGKLESVEPRRTMSDLGADTGSPALVGGKKGPSLAASPPITRPVSGDWSGQHIERCRSDEALTTTSRRYTTSAGSDGSPTTTRSRSPPPLDQAAAVERALALSKKLSISNIQTHVTNRGDVMLDMQGYKLDAEEIAQAESLARKILAEEMEGDYDFDSLITADRNGNLWIYSSEEAKASALASNILPPNDLISDAGYSSDEAKSDGDYDRSHRESSTPPSTPPSSPPPHITTTSSSSYAKTLRLTSDQLKSLNLKPGANSISFSVNRATCNAYMYLWRHDVPIVVSDVDGTITKSDALGHVFTMIGRDWTHLGVAKLYTDIAANGYNIMYLTSRSVGQADTTRNYLNGIVQDSYKLPRGPVIMSPDRTFHALRREVYLRKPEVFKMACLRDILSLFGPSNPFYAGFGNRLTDALSYRSVNIPSTRIFTINSNAEVSLDLLCLTRYKSSYVNMRDLVDHFFPPVERTKNIAEEYTDFNFWREPAPDVDFSDSDADDSDIDDDDLPVDSYLDEDDDADYESEYDSDYHPDDIADATDDDDELDDDQVDAHELAEEAARFARNHDADPRHPPAMKNDLDRTPLDSVRDFAEHEIGAVVEELGDGFGRLLNGGRKNEKKPADEETVLPSDASIDD